MELCLLSQLKEGERAVVLRLDSADSMRRRLQDIGLVPGGGVACIGRSPLGDPAAYYICGAVIALREEDASGIYVAKGVSNGAH